MAAYLKTVPALREAGQTQQRSSAAGNPQALPSTLEPLIDRSPTAMTDSSSGDGAQLYEGACASCHQPNGKGTADQFYPSLTHNSAVGDVRADNLIMAIVDGVHRDTNDYKVSMPAFAEQMNNEQIAAVSNFVLQRFGNQGVSATVQKVQALRQGGPAPLLIKAMPYLMAGGAIVGVLIVLLIVRVSRKRKA
jgi:D-sorbitol dehydrogenase (acceptor)